MAKETLLDAQPQTEEGHKPRRKLVANPTLVALSDIIDLFGEIPAGDQAWALDYLCKTYGKVAIAASAPRNGVGA